MQLDLRQNDTHTLFQLIGHHPEDHLLTAFKTTGKTNRHRQFKMDMALEDAVKTTAILQMVQKF